MIWLIFGGVVFAVGQFAYYFWCTPERTPRPIRPSVLDKVAAYSLYGLAYCLSLLRLPFAVLPYCVKAFGVLILRRHYLVSRNHPVYEAIRIVGDIVNWGLGILVLEHVAALFPSIRHILLLSILAEAFRLFAEKGQMALSAMWQLLPHRRLALYLSTKQVEYGFQPALGNRIARYCQYFGLDDAARIQFLLDALRAYSAIDPEATEKLSYLSTLRIVAGPQGLRGGFVRDVARGEVFIHRQWLSDPRLVIGQALRRAPWYFDPRFLARPFRYRSQSNRLATLFVLNHARYCPTYALYQLGHEIKVARYDYVYRLLRRLKIDIEPVVQSDGTAQFDPLLSWAEHNLFCMEKIPQSPLWTDHEVILDIRRRIANGECLSALDIAVKYTYPVKYVEEILSAKIRCGNGSIYL